MYKFTVNGLDVEIDIDPDTSLLWVLRESLELTGTKYSCGIGVCGACSVIIDGKLVKSCITKVKDILGSHIETIEGYKLDNVMSVIQKTWVDANVPECGYCQSGQIIAATVLLRKNKNPNTNEIIKSMSGNLCRCGTYNRIIEAINIASSKIRENNNV